MTVTLTTRLGITRWSDDDDPWSREQFDADNAVLESLVVIGAQGLDEGRPGDHVARRLYLATDTHKVYVDDGTTWTQLLTPGTIPAGAAAFTGAPAGTPAAATDLATTTALVNYLRTRLLALGAVAT